jgi:hypothetical protein
MNTLTQEQAEKIQNFVYEEDVELRESYSGRGMYGKSCFGLVGRNVASIGMKLTAYLADSDELDLAVSLAKCANQDSMGMEGIIYFPGFEWPTSEESSDDSDEEIEEEDEEKG